MPGLFRWWTVLFLGRLSEAQRRPAKHHPQQYGCEPPGQSRLGEDAQQVACSWAEHFEFTGTFRPSQGILAGGTARRRGPAKGLKFLMGERRRGELGVCL
jgi:hypothetical protein